MINRLYLKRQNERFKQRPKLTEPRDIELAAQRLLSSMQKQITVLQGWCVGESLGQSLGHRGTQLPPLREGETETGRWSHDAYGTRCGGE